MSSTQDEETLDIEASFDESAANALLQVTLRRGHNSANDALNEAIMLQASFMAMARKGYRFVIRDPQGDELEFPFNDLDETLFPH